MNPTRHYLKKLRRRTRRLRGDPFVDVWEVNNRPIIGGNPGSLRISNLITSQSPGAIGRFGTTEAYALEYCMDTSSSRYLPMPRKIGQRLSQLSGFFPSDKKSIYRFYDQYVEIAPDFDLIACRTKAIFGNYLEIESQCVSQLCPEAIAIDQDLIYEPFGQFFGWVKALQGQRVLVVHPFANLIKQQYEQGLVQKREIHLPKFDLTVLAPAQTLGKSLEKTYWLTWFDALEDMKNSMADMEFDVALIAAGAYGPFLAQHCKSLGRKGIHVGGALQIYFQIAGRRWDDPESLSYIGDLKSPGWIRPGADLRPEGYEEVENGCYW